MFDEANAPAPNEGGRPKPADLKDHLLIVRVVKHSLDNPLGVVRKSKNAETGQDIENPADCIIADVVDLDADDQPVFYDYVFLQSKLIQHFKTNVGKTLIGSLGQQPNVGDRQGAYFFTDQFKFGRQRSYAEAWVANHPEFFGSQAPGNADRKSNAPTGNGGSAESESANAGSGSTLDRMRNSGNDSEEAPF